LLTVNLQQGRDGHNSAIVRFLKFR
jgi:hypothetical protein